MAHRIKPRRKDYLMMSRTRSGLRLYPCEKIFKKFEGKKINVLLLEDYGIIQEHYYPTGTHGVSFGVQNPPSCHMYRTQIGNPRKIVGISALPEEFGQVELKWWWFGDEVRFSYPNQYPEPITFIKPSSRMRRAARQSENFAYKSRSEEPVREAARGASAAMTNTMALSNTLSSLFDALGPSDGPHEHLKHAMEVVNSYADDPEMFPEVVFQVELYNDSGEVTEVIKTDRPFRLVAKRKRIKYEDL